ncbi:uracil phosphoribosyltransferase [Moniliophthora roreri MCA 2997]|uniref:uracil phosphoribosyltransferase n=1 Tax=Moniliophthora roreri (strain MCA 2997) TaxID=1381753 RepID=V2XEG0_MONRO|nr:uracil phosphoribosyltransferase [Moniliophthora roreri MCA 2997]
MSINVLNHPIVNTQLSKLRQANTSSKDFREGIHQISLILGIEATRSLEQVPFEGDSPVGRFTGSVIKPQIGLTPILRAGLGMSDALLSLLPEAPVYHLGLFREKVSLQPVEYYSKLPATPPVDMVYILDPLIATGGTARAALQMVLDWGIPADKIKLLCVLASKQGVQAIHEEFPTVEIWVAAVDNELTSQGIISPGLGDAGDRLFNTIRQ